MKCLLCNEWIEPVAQLSDLIMFKQRREYSCEDCKAQFKKLGKARCSNCYKIIDGNSCFDCKIWAKKGYFSRYKFMGDYCLRKIFQQEIKANLKSFLKKGYILVPVPLSEERLEERGFNQVKGLLEGIPYKNIFEKREIEKQSSRTREERLSQDNSFSLKKGIELPSKIIIIDDIYTTGSTLYQMVKLLDGLDVKEILTFSLAR